MRACAFFSPSLDPVLNRGEGDKDAVVAPQVPTRWAVGHAVLNHEPHRQIGEVGTKVLATLSTVMLGIGHQQITRTPHVEIPQVMERPMRLLVPIGRVPTTRARLSEVIAAVGDNLGLGQVFGGCDPGAGVGSVLTWTEHRIALLAQRFGPDLTISVFWRQPGALATVSLSASHVPGAAFLADYDSGGRLPMAVSENFTGLDNLPTLLIFHNIWKNIGCKYGGVSENFTIAQSS